MEIHAGLSFSSVTNNSPEEHGDRSGRTPRGPASIYPGQQAQYVPVRLESRYLTDSRFCLSVRPVDASLDQHGKGREGGGQTSRQIHKDDRAFLAPLSRNLYK